MTNFIAVSRQTPPVIDRGKVRIPLDAVLLA